MEKTPRLPFILITALFLAWGIANNMTDTLLAAFKRIMSMTDYQTTFVQYTFYGAYFCFAMPAALFIKKFTYKSGVLLGLGMFILGALLFYPASKTMDYWHFLVALYILAGGLSFLETSANPFIVGMGPPETGTQRLNLAQSFNPVGSITGVLLSKLFILSQLNHADADERAIMDAAQLQAIQTQELAAVMGPYVGVALALLVLWLMITFTPMPSASDADSSLHVGASIKRLLKNRNYVWAVTAQFFYVGAQIGVWSFTIRYVMQELDLNEEQASSYYLAALVLFLVSRFASTWLMRYFRATSLLIALSLLAMGLASVVVLASGHVAVYALVGISACMSLMFPTIYALGLVGLGDDTKIGGSGLVMAILGGALITGVQGQVSDLSGSIHLAYVVPMFCFGVVAYYGSVAKKIAER